MSLCRYNRPTLTAANHKRHCSTGWGDEIPSKERHFCPLAAILENTRDAIPLGRYVHRHTSCGHNSKWAFFELWHCSPANICSFRGLTSVLYIFICGDTSKTVVYSAPIKMSFHQRIFMPVEPFRTTPETLKGCDRSWTDVPTPVLI